MVTKKLQEPQVNNNLNSDLRNFENGFGDDWPKSFIGDRLMRETEVFKILGIGVSTGQQWRLKGLGPRFIKIGRMVRYRESDVTAYIASLKSYASTSAVDEGL